MMPVAILLGIFGCAILYAVGCQVENGVEELKKIRTIMERRL